MKDLENIIRNAIGKKNEEIVTENLEETAYGAANFLNKKWHEHKIRTMFNKTFAKGNEVKHNDNGKVGVISGNRNKETGKYPVKWADGSTSHHYATNADADGIVPNGKWKI